MGLGPLPRQEGDKAPADSRSLPNGPFTPAWFRTCIEEKHSLDKARCVS